MKLRGVTSLESIQPELDEYESDKNNFTKDSIPWSDLWHCDSLRRPLIVSLVLNMSQQFGGINAVSFYSAIIFSKAGLVDNWPIYCTVMVSCAQFLMSFVCMALIDRLGRKSLLLLSLSGMGASCVGLSVFDLVYSKYSEYSVFNYLIVVCVVMFILFFGAGSGSIPNLITVELFDSNERGKANSVACLVNW
jgi:MFS family permease